MISKLAEKISDVIFDQCIELMTGCSKEQIGAMLDRYTEKKKYEKYRISLDEEILKKYGNEKFYDELCNALLCTPDLDRLISRCMDRSVVDDESEEEFVRAILAQCNLGPGEMSEARDCIKYISDKTFESFNHLWDAENIKLKNIIIRQTEKTLEEIRNLRKEISEIQEKRDKLPEQEFYWLWKQSQIAASCHAGDEANIHEQLLIFLDKQIAEGQFDELCAVLPGPVESVDKTLPEFMCEGSHDRPPLFYAQVLVWLSRAYLGRTGRTNRKLLDHCRIRNYIERAEKIVNACSADAVIDIEYAAECETVCGELAAEINAVQEQLEYMERELMRKSPAVKVNQDNDAFAVFEPVFSGCFDSVTGQDESKLNDLELNVFQLAASGKTILLQGPQIVDNRNMLRLLHTHGFEMLCRMGIVVFSSYGGIRNTDDFIKSRLLNENFKFSSFPEYDDPDMGPHLRRIVLNGLENHQMFQEIEGYVPHELRESLELIYDGYWLAGECFRESDILRYHQNREIRTSKFHLHAREINEMDRGLPGILHEKIKELEEDQHQVSIKGREEYLRCFAEIEHLAQLPDPEGKCCKIRSDYEYLIDRLKAQGRFSEEVLEKFRRLVHSCYILYNGKFSCEKVIIPMADPMLCIYHKNQTLQENVCRVDYAYRRYKRMSSAEQNVVGWADIVNLVLDARDVMADPDIPSGKKAGMMKQATGLVYAEALDQTPYVKEMSAKTLEGKQIDVLDRALDSNAMEGSDTQECYQTPIEPALE